MKSQKSMEYTIERPREMRGEAKQRTGRDDTKEAHHKVHDLGCSDLLEQVVASENMRKAWKRVEANKGSAGVDGLSIEATKAVLKTTWGAVKTSLLNGTYRPQPLREVKIPKGNGGTRTLGIPTVTDRVIQQAILQILQPMIDPSFSESSYGFRPGRKAQDAISKAQEYVQAGYEIVVDVDLESFFDRVNHDIMMHRLSKRVSDKKLLRLIRRYLEAGIMQHGITRERHEGTPQGGALSPLLANILLDEVDKELEKRGHKFVRYADDCNIYVRSQKAGERVLQSLRRLYEKLHLKVNESKTAVDKATKRKFLSFRFHKVKGEVKRAICQQAIAKFKYRIRRITRQGKGMSIKQMVENLRSYMMGWKGYFGFAQTRSTLQSLEEWIRHRLRAMHLKQWKRGKTSYKALVKLGAPKQSAAIVAKHTRRWWHNSCLELNRLLPISYFDQLGVPRLT